MERRVFRNEDFSLSEEQEALRSTLAAFFAKECPTTVVRKAEPLGFDADLWGRLVELGVVTMGVPEPLGGDGAGLVELALAPRSTVARWRPCRSSSRGHRRRRQPGNLAGPRAPADRRRAAVGRHRPAAGRHQGDR